MASQESVPVVHVGTGEEKLGTDGTDGEYGDEVGITLDGDGGMLGVDGDTGLAVLTGVGDDGMDGALGDEGKVGLVPDGAEGTGGDGELLGLGADGGKGVGGTLIIFVVTESASPHRVPLALVASAFTLATMSPDLQTLTTNGISALDIASPGRIRAFEVIVVVTPSRVKVKLVTVIGTEPTFLALM
jgi:hypothetical protein